MADAPDRVQRLAAAAHDPARTAELPPVRLRVRGAVPTIEWPDPRLIEFVKADKPVILRNGALAKSAVERWDAAYLARHLGAHNRFDVYAGTDNRCFRYYDQDKNTGGYKYTPTTEKLSLTFHEFLERLAAHAEKPPGERVYHYFQQTLYEGVGPEIVRDVGEFQWEFLASLTAAAGERVGRLLSNVVWMGPAGVVTPAHYDECHNFFCQVRGRKRFVLLPPDAFPLLYPFPVAHACDRQSQVDLYEPDMRRFPRFAEAEAVEAAVGPGDVLYLPACWWHHVESLSDNISVNFWLEQAKATPHSLQQPISGVARLSVRRNIEKMLASVLPPREIGPFLKELVDGRFDLPLEDGSDGGGGADTPTAAEGAAGRRAS